MLKHLIVILCGLGSLLQAEVPLELKPNTRLCLIGNSLFDRMRDDGTFEALLQQHFPNHHLVVRNLAWSADEVALRPRPDGFGDLNQHLTEHQADVILAAFGFNESFKGQAGLAEFETLLKAFLIELKSHRYNGHSAPEIVLVSPTPAEAPHEDLNAQIQLYSEAMQRVAAREGVRFANLYHRMAEQTVLQNQRSENPRFTLNGVHLNAKGYYQMATLLYNELFYDSPAHPTQPLIQAVVEKETKFFQYYRPLNYYYIKGGRAEPYGVVNFPNELEKLKQMVANRDQLIWDLASGKTPAPRVAFAEGEIQKLVDDSKTRPLPEITGDRPINEWMSPEDELKAFKIDPRFEVSLFASEEDFPDLFKKPIAIRFDTKGRLWVSTSITYPQILPGHVPEDQILILEDTNGDHKADKCSVWADKLHIPLSFEFGNGGVYVSDQPNLTFVKDTDGDGKADFREKILTGFGTEDSHHALHDFAWSPEGDLIFRESLFHHSQVETPYGPVRARESSFFRYTPATGRLQTFGSYLSTNPWGITFDDWGFHVGSHPIFAAAVHALNPPYPEIHVPAGSYFPAYSGTCGHEFLTSSHWPEALRHQKHFMKVRYKPTNEVELHEWVQQDSHFEEKKVGIVFQSTNLSFIPVDIQQGPDGAMYVADWYNPVKGHMQYSLRDTRRDKKSGRIWRITAKDRPLEETPKIAEASIPELLNLLKSENDRTRYRAKEELREKDSTEVLAALRDWPQHNDQTANLNHDLVEKLWLYRSLRFGAPPTKEAMKEEVALIRTLAENKDPKVRANAARALRWTPSEWTVEGTDQPTSLRLRTLQATVNDPIGLVRLEAAIAASYIGTPEALETVLDLLKHPMDDYLTYALRTTLDSYTLQPLWKGNTAFMTKHPELETFLKASEPKKPTWLSKKKKAEKPDPFDSQPGLQLFTIKTIPERLLFDLREFKVKAGSPVKLVFENPDVTPHNLLIVQPGAADEVGMAGNEMAKSPDGMSKGFIPDHPKILHHTKMLMQNEAETLRFQAPDTPGRYPYICTFPGHWLVMKGEMIVE